MTSVKSISKDNVVSKVGSQIKKDKTEGMTN